MATLKQLAEIGLPDLISFDRDEQVEEIFTRIQNDQEWNSLDDGQLFQNSTFMLLSYFTYLFEKAATSQNRITRENFIEDAVDDNSVVKHLSRNNVNLTQNTHSRVEVNGTVQNGILTEDLVIPVSTQLFAADLNGDNATFEFIGINESTGKPDYFTDIVIPATPTTRDTFQTQVFSGETIVKEFPLEPNFTENFKLTIVDQDIIENSIVVIYQKDKPDETELLKSPNLVVSPSFTNPSVFPDGTPHFVEKFNATGGAELLFGSEAFGGAFPEPTGKTITVYYRVGGGAATNITEGGINIVLAFDLNPLSTLNILFVNSDKADGGSDRESIFEAQVFGPLRIGRLGPVVDDIDALNLLRTMVTKHRVDDPKLNPDNNRVPILHMHHFIAPLRNLDSYILPEPLVEDDVDSYAAVFEADLSNFLNVQGLHDGLVQNEPVTDFVSPDDLGSYDFTQALGLKKPLNGTLFVSGHKLDGSEIDRLTWSDNYVGTENIPDVGTDQAFVLTGDITNVVVTGTENNQLVLTFDELPAPITITIPAGLFGTAEPLATAINTEITGSDPYFSVTHAGKTFAIAENNQVKIISPITGEPSKIVVGITVDPNDSANTLIGLDEQFKRAEPRSGIVFLEAGSNLNIDTSEVTYAINTNTHSQIVNESDVSLWVQDPSQKPGPIVPIILFEEDGVELAQVQLTTDIVLEAFDGASLLIDSITFPGIQDSDSNVGQFDTNSTGNVFKNTTQHNYNYDTSEASVVFVESADASAPFSAGFVAPAFLRVTYLRKNYEFITATYQPNQYFPEDEAKDFIDKLRARDKRMVGFEHIIKRVQFIPTKVVGEVTSSPGNSAQRVRLNSIELTQERFGYDNNNPDSEISAGFNVERLKALLNDSVENPGVQSVTITQPAVNIVDPVGDKYYFTLPDTILAKLGKVEASFPNVAGIRARYSIDFTGVQG